MSNSARLTATVRRAELNLLRAELTILRAGIEFDRIRIVDARELVRRRAA